MKHLIVVLLCSMTLLMACKQQKSAYYELVGGDVHVDFIEFMNDSVARYIGPEGMEHQTLYAEKGNDITIQIAPLVEATLKRIDNNTLEGRPPFFEGTWKKR